MLHLGSLDDLLKFTLVLVLSPTNCPSNSLGFATGAIQDVEVVSERLRDLFSSKVISNFNHTKAIMNIVRVKFELSC